MSLAEFTQRKTLPKVFVVLNISPTLSLSEFPLPLPLDISL